MSSGSTSPGLSPAPNSTHSACAKPWVRPTRLGVSDGLVGEVGEAVPDPLGVEEAHGFLVAGLAEEALPGAEHDRVDHQPQLVDEVVLHQRAHELEAGVDDDLPA